MSTNTAIPTRRADFTSSGVTCAAWLTLPRAPGPHPAIVLVHGLGATREMMLPQYEQHFAAAGIATLAFDYRCTGASEGAPRQHFSMRRQLADVTAALTHLAGRPGVDPRRIGVWGTSLGAMNAVRAAARRRDVRAVVVQCPIVHGPGAARALGPLGALRTAPDIALDAMRAIAGRSRRYVPIVGPPGGRGVVTAAGAEAGWNSTVPEGVHFDNRIAAADAVGLITASALRDARRVVAPLLVCVCDRENLMDPKYAALVARRAPHGIARHYDGDHFEVYHPPLVDRVLADQTAFLVEHLRVDS